MSNLKIVNKEQLSKEQFRSFQHFQDDKNQLIIPCCYILVLHKWICQRLKGYKITIGDHLILLCDLPIAERTHLGVFLMGLVMNNRMVFTVLTSLFYYWHFYDIF